jgi:hypothetical protein
VWWCGHVITATLASINIIFQAIPDIQARPYIKHKQQNVAGRVTQGHTCKYVENNFLLHLILT